MVQQAADSVVKAYADGINRQSVQLSLGKVLLESAWRA